MGVLIKGLVQPSTGRRDESGGQNQIAFLMGFRDPKIILAFGTDLNAFYPLICIVFNEQFTMTGRSTNQQVL